MAISLSSSDTFLLKETSGTAPVSRLDQSSYTDAPAWVNAAGALGITKQWNSGGPVALNTTSVNLNLTSGLIGADGVARAFLKVKFLRIKNSGAAGVLTVGGASSNAWVGMLTGTIILPLGAVLKVWSPDANGWPVVPSTGDILKVLNSGNGSY